MFEPDIESEVWRSLEGHNVTVWKLFSSSGVHFVRFKHLHIFMLVEKKYPLTHVTITGMLNKKLQNDQRNEMCYQLLELMTKQQKNPGSMLQNIDREDLETLWKLVKAKHGNKRPEEAYERVLWGDLKVMFEPDIESEVWRSLEGHNVIVWKLFSSSGVHFV
ncbi:hypothetical protein Tco_1007827 [Tanacetum coccineum]